MTPPLQRFDSLNQFNFHDTLADADGVSIVLFTKPGCSSCGKWRELLQNYVRKHLDTRLFEVDASADQALAQEFELFHLPSIHLFRNGEYFGELQCEARETVLGAALQDALARPPQDMP